MLRIISGKYWNRKLFMPKKDNTRPMTDKMREALFNILGDVEGLRFADLYAGTGSIGLEALSRGAAHVDGVDSNRGVAKILKKNVEKLEANREYTIYNKDVARWLDASAETYDIIVADPPYADIEDEAFADISYALEPKGLFILHHERRHPAPQLQGLELLKSRKYGQSMLSFYRKT